MEQIQQLAGRGIELRVGTECNLSMDADVKAVLEFMQSNMSTSKLVGVAQAVAAVATVAWGQYEREDVRALALREASVS